MQDNSKFSVVSTMLRNSKVFNTVLLILIACAQLSIFADTLSNVGNDFLSNRFTRTETLVAVKSPFTLDGYSKITENKILELWMNLENTSLRVVDKRTGYIWGDVIDDTEAYNEMNDTYKSIAKSVVMLEYFDERGISNVLGSADSQVRKSWKKTNNGIIYTFNFENLQIQFSVSISLINDRIIFSLPQNTIKESGKYTIASVIFSPFLGSTISDQTYGYAFVPDGPGALIRFSKPAHYLNWFEKRVYGKDYAIENLVSVNDLRANRPNDFLREEPTVLMPVFGIVHGVKQNALFGVITSGREYSAIISYPSGILSQYNWTSAKFIYRQKYLQPTTRSGAGIQVAQKNKNKFEAMLEITFLTGNNADYVGMAKYYREHFGQKLFSKRTETRTSNDIPLFINVLASDIEKMIIGHRVIPITHTNKMKEIVNILEESGVKNIVLLIEGWQKGGLNGNKISKFGLERKSGSLEEFVIYIKDLSAKSGKKISVYFVDNVTKVTEKQINLKTEVGTNLSQSIIFEERDNKELWLYRSFYTKIDLAAKYLSLRANGLFKQGIENVAFKEFASKLYGDLKRGSEIYRNDALKIVQNTLKDISTNAEGIILFEPNDYAWQYATTFGSIPMNSSQYLFETDTVPFLQIVLSGSIEYFTPYMNNGFFSKFDVLKSIEYGAYPSFVISGLDNSSLKDTRLWDYPSTMFDDWKDKIIEIYKVINSALRYVKGAKITDRVVLKPGLVKVSYNNGYSIVVNYTKSLETIGNITVQPESFRVVYSRNGADEK
ncbi:DUF5696 domain-containing protein [Fervidobacterium sp.]